MLDYFSYIKGLKHPEDSVVNLTCEYATIHNSKVCCTHLDICDDGLLHECVDVSFTCCNRKKYYIKHPDKLEKLINKNL